VINGAAAHKAGRGDVIILATYADYEDVECRRHQPSLVFVDARNRIVVQSHERIDEEVLAAAL
jgi:aspartate 1-decarboxylase